MCRHTPRYCHRMWFVTCARNMTLIYPNEPAASMCILQYNSIKIAWSSVAQRAKLFLQRLEANARKIIVTKAIARNQFAIGTAKVRKELIAEIGFLLISQMIMKNEQTILINQRCHSLDKALLGGGSVGNRQQTSSDMLDRHKTVNELSEWCWLSKIVCHLLRRIRLLREIIVDGIDLLRGIDLLARHVGNAIIDNNAVHIAIDCAIKILDIKNDLFHSHQFEKVRC